MKIPGQFSVQINNLLFWHSTAANAPKPEERFDLSAVKFRRPDNSALRFSISGAQVIVVQSGNNLRAALNTFAGCNKVGACTA